MPESSAHHAVASSIATVQMEKPVYGGTCLARVEGKAVFVPLTLPGEEARIRVSASKSAYANAEAEEILNASPDRVAPVCAHFSACGGCNYQHASYESQLKMKEAILRETLERGGVNVPEDFRVLSAEPQAYRNRIRLALDAKLRAGYRGRRSHTILPIEECPIAAPLLVKAAHAFQKIAQSFPALRPSEIALFCDAEEQSLLAILTAQSVRKFSLEALGTAWASEIPALRGVELLIESSGKSGAQPRSVARWGENSLAYRAANFDYRVDQGAFFQVNRWLVDALVERVLGDARGALAWDLYAGVGLFARQLTSSFQRVVAVESAPASTQALTANLKGTRGIPVRSTTLDFLRNPRAAGRAESTTPDLIVVDPPRMGLGAEVSTLLSNISAPRLAYVSCDPATLARDLAQLCASGYTLNSVSLVDLFPHTYHMETVAQLTRTSEAAQ